MGTSFSFLGDCIRVRFRPREVLLCIDIRERERERGRGWMRAQRALQDMTGHVVTCIVPSLLIVSYLVFHRFLSSWRSFVMLQSKWTGVDRANERRWEESRGRVCFVTYSCRRRMIVAHISCKRMQVRTRESHG